ncbi:Immunoglobulin C-2 Type [Desmophyllum pertusum]|uniref:Immunoglobulin C-2 Type n=1 Tax=Desmophyllum pertusum TaxID=174260 RepID=A0A9W9ZA35_9CNID|nr:Immunoglobulin C-2 Type [Desmophyllum pertusum]
MWSVAFSVWIWTAFTVLVPAQSNPPVITDFLQKDLVNPEDVKFSKDVGFTLPCKATGSNLKWSWEHNGTAIEAYNGRPFTLSEDGTLTGSGLVATDSGTYQCFVKDEVTGAVAFSRKLKVAVTDSEDFTLPAWSVTPNAEETAVQGRNKTLYCFATGRPSPTITWKKDGQIIVHEENSYKVPGPSLEDAFSSTMLTRKNTREVPPKWTTDPPPTNLSIVIEKNGTLECKVTANPVATVSWYKDGLLLQSSKRRVLVGSKLHFIDVNLNDTGVYQCEAGNKHGMIISSTWIHVSAWKPSFANVQFGPFHLLNEKEAKMPCKPSTAAPRPTIEWFKDGNLITYGKNSRYRLEMDGTLVIKQSRQGSRWRQLHLQGNELKG